MLQLFSKKFYKNIFWYKDISFIWVQEQFIIPTWYWVVGKIACLKTYGGPCTYLIILRRHLVKNLLMLYSSSVVILERWIDRLYSYSVRIRSELSTIIFRWNRKINIKCRNYEKWFYLRSKVIAVFSWE